jgi:hypothetical protein
MVKIEIFMFWHIIVTRKYLAEWMTTGVIQRTETLQRFIDLETVSLQNVEMSHLYICKRHFDLFLALEIKCL